MKECLKKNKENIIAGVVAMIALAIIIYFIFFRSSGS